MTASLIPLIVFFFRYYFSDIVKMHLWESVIVLGQIMMLMVRLMMVLNSWKSPLKSLQATYNNPNLFNYDIDD